MHVRVCVFGQLSGTFIITAGGVPTAALPYNITSAALQAALSALPAVGNVAVSRSGPDTQLGYVWSITYLALTGNVAEPTVDFAALVGVGKSAALVQVCVPVCVCLCILRCCLHGHACASRLFPAAQTSTRNAKHRVADSCRSLAERCKRCRLWSLRQSTVAPRPCPATSR